MSNLTLRTTTSATDTGSTTAKASALSHSEMDSNLILLNNEKLENISEDTTPQLGADLDVNGQKIVSTANGDIDIEPNGTGDVLLGNFKFDADQSVGASEDDYVLTYDNATGKISLEAASSGGISNVVEDTTPQLGGDLDGQGNKVENVELDDYKETIYTGGSTTGTITPDVANGNVQAITLTGNITFNAFSNAETGQTMTLIITQSSTGGETLTSTMKFAGGEKTLSTAANAVDILSVFYDGTNYYASLSTNFS